MGLSILLMMTSCPCRWEPRPSAQLLQAVAAATEGYAGADLAALATSAVMAAVRRAAPGLIADLDHHIRQPPASSPAQPPAGSGVALEAAPGAQEQQENVASVAAEGHVAVQAHDAAELAEVAGSSGVQEAAADGMTCPGSSAMQQEGAQQEAQTGPAEAPQQPPDEGNTPHPAAAALQGIVVRAADWREALCLAPQPCARRQGLAALCAEASKPLPARLLPPLAPVLARMLAALHCSRLPLAR